MGLQRIRSRLAAASADESGFTVFELLVTMMVMILVMIATLNLLDSSAKQAPKDGERAHSISEAQQSLDGMVRELRQAYRIEGWTSDSVRMDVRVLRGGTHVNLTVDYSCGVENPGQCVRREAPAGSALPANGQVVVSRLLNYQSGLPASRRVFNFDQSTDRSNPAYAAAIVPTYVTVRLEVPAKGERRAAGGYRHTVVLDDGFYARNLEINY